MRPRRGAASSLLLGALSLAAAAYWPALHGEFQYDDMPAIAANARAKALGAALDGFWSRYAGGRPLTDVTFALDHAWSGISTWGYHLTSLGLHLAVGLLVFALARLLLRRAGLEGRAVPAALVAALFVLHPLNSQAVAYLAQRSEVLASLLYLAALLALLGAEERWGTAYGAGLYALAAASFALALAAKPVAATLPAAFLLVRYALPGGVAGSPPDRGAADSLPPLRPARPAQERASTAAAPRGFAVRPLLLSIPFFLGAAVVARLSLAATAGQEDAGFDIPSLGPGVYLLTQSRALARYLSLLLWPAGQNLDYDFPASHGLLDPPATLAALLLLGVLAGAAALGWRWAGPRPTSPTRRAARLAAMGFFWFLLLLAPSSSVLPLADLIEEHRPYLASFGPCLAAGGALACLAAGVGARQRRLLVAGAALICLALAATLHARARVWSSRLTLWADVARKSPGKGRAHMNLGHALEQGGRLEEAVVEYRRALELSARPFERTSTQVVARYEVLRNLGSTFLSLHQLDDAAAAFREANALAPTNGDILSSLAMVSLDRSDLAGAEAWAERALALDPDDGRAENTLGEVRLARGDLEGAYRSFSRAARLDPDNAVRAFNSGMAADRLGRSAEACGAYGRYLQLRAQAGAPDPEVQTRWRALGCATAASAQPRNDVR